jgi:hypothetical protein
MTAGLSAVNLANKWLDMLSGTAFTAPAASYVVAYIGDPGAAGTNNTITSITRQAVTWSAAATGVKTISNSPTWTSWSFTSPSAITHLSFWDASSAGNFLFSVAVAQAQTVVTGNNLVVSPASILFSPVAA